MPDPIRLFYSYSHKDEKLRMKLNAHLALLRRERTINEWHARKISAGAEWQGEIDANLEPADLILLLVSADFINSNYCLDVEVKRAMERHNARAIDQRNTTIMSMAIDCASSIFEAGKVHRLKRITVEPQTYQQ